MSITELREHKQRISTIDPSLLLGQLAWYEVEEVTLIDYDRFIELTKQYGLDHVRPNPPTDANVFRRVVTNAERKRVPAEAEDVSWNFLLRQVQNSGNTIQRRLVLETVDSAGQRLDYEQLVDLFYNKDTGAITTVRLQYANVSAADDVVRSIIKTVRSDFARQKNSLNGSAIRDWIRHVLDRARATSVRHGVYFLTQAQASTISALEQVADELSSVRVHSLPLIDDRKQREMLLRAFEDETVGEVDRMMGEIAEALKKGTKVSHDRKVAYLGRFQELSEKTQEYAALLEQNLSGTSSRLGLFRKQVMTLMGSA